jgi:D-lactate dehydrogenase (cytochrome)
MDPADVIRDPDHLKSFLNDASGVHGSADGVIHPVSIDDVRRVLRTASAESIPVTVAGSRTGLAGGSVPTEGIVLSTDRVRPQFEFDEERLLMRVGAGHRLAEVQEYATARGLLYPPDPTESLASIGGNLATNASGARTYRYGPTRAWIEGLTVVLADGEILELARGRCRAVDGELRLETSSGRTIYLQIPPYVPPATTKNAAGYFLSPDMDAVDLFIGSEGTLGVILGGLLRLIPAPDEVFSGLLFFVEEESMLLFVEELRSASGPISPRCIEFIDAPALDAIRPDWKEIPEGTGGGAIWFEQEGGDVVLLEAWDRLMRRFTPLVDSSFFGFDEGLHRRLRAIRHAVPTMAHERLVSRGVRKYGTDIAVPDERFREMFGYYRSYIEETELESMTWGHIGNSHLHVNILPHAGAEEERAKQAFDDFVSYGLELGGTVSAEHGIGKIKCRFLVQMLGHQVVEGMKRIKTQLDPDHLLGRGTMFEA